MNDPQLRWLRLWTDIVDDPKLLLLAAADRWYYVTLLALKRTGMLDEPDTNIMRDRKLCIRLRLDERELDELKRRLIEVRLIDTDWSICGWDKRQFTSDSSTARVRKYRHKGNVSETLHHRFGNGPESEQSQSRAETEQILRTMAPAVPSEFEEFKSVYPKRNGNQPWQKALKACKARIAGGSTWQQINAGAQAYASWCRSTGKEATEHVMQAATFCGPDKPFLQLWHAPPKAETAMDRIRRLNSEAGRTFDGEQDTAVVVAISGPLRG